MSSKSQCKRVLDFMSKNNGITSMQCSDILRISRLSARIYDLRCRGYEIGNEKRKGKCDRYYLIGEPK